MGLGGSSGPGSDCTASGSLVSTSEVRGVSQLRSKQPPTFGKRGQMGDGGGRLAGVRSPGPRPPGNLEALKSPGMLPFTISRGLHPQRSHLSACFPGGETEACTFEEEVGLGQVQLVPKGDTCVLHSRAGLKLHAHLQLWGAGGNTESASQTGLRSTQAPGHPRLAASPHSRSLDRSPGHWLCGSTWRACPPGPASLSPASCSL